jgi:hypothetical protein
MIVRSASHGDYLCIPCKWINTLGSERRRRVAPLPVCVKCSSRILPPAVGIHSPAATPPPPLLSLPRTTLPSPLPAVDLLIRRMPRPSKVFDSCPSSHIPVYTRLLTERLGAAASASDATAHEAIAHVELCYLIARRRLMRGERGWHSEKRQLAALRLRMERTLRGEFGDLWFEREEARKASARLLHHRQHRHNRLPRLLPRKKHADCGWRRGIRAGKGTLAPCRLCSVTRYVIRTTLTYVRRFSTFILLLRSLSCLFLSLSHPLPIKSIRRKSRRLFVG